MRAATLEQAYGLAWQEWWTVRTPNRAAQRVGRGVVTVACLHHRAGSVPDDLLAELDAALRTHLAL